jgi:hypothetical protein
LLSVAPGHPMTVRPPTVSDAPGIAGINVQTWRVAYRGQIPDAVLDALSAKRRTVGWQEWLTQTQGQVFVAEDGGSIVGFCDLIQAGWSYESEQDGGWESVA